jgi:hypothetical protein
LISDFRPATGDVSLHDLLNDATTASCLATEPTVRSLDKLWDAVERLKTLRNGGRKKASLEKLLTERRSPMQRSSAIL